jgi:hypothetical protein
MAWDPLEGIAEPPASGGPSVPPQSMLPTLIPE